MAITFPLARYRFDFEVTSALRLPEYGGSTLRGAFGRALRKLACVTRSNSCQGCLLLQTCPFPSVFEPAKPESISLANIATLPVPYVIEAPKWGLREYAPGEILSFGFILMGNAQHHLPICIMAWRRAFAQGVGAGDGTAQLACVNWLDEKEEPVLIYQPGGSVKDHPKHVTATANAPSNKITLRFETPLRLQHQGHALSPARLDPRPLLMALARRASLLSEIYGGGPLYKPGEFSAMAEAARQVEGKHNLVWRDWTRHSSRQQRTMQLGGCIGDWALEGDLAPFWDILHLGRLLHVGKEASFGLGKYQILTL